MTKQEFLSELTNSLEGEVPSGVIREQINFYASYIDTQISCGKTEEQVLEELGSPRLIARTIIDSTEAGGEDFQKSYRSAEEYEQYGESNQRGSAKGEPSAAFKGIMILILIVLILICVLGTIFRFLFSPFGLVFILFVLVYFWYASRYR